MAISPEPREEGANGGVHSRISPLHPAGAFLRRLAYAGARYGPAPWVRYSSAAFGVAFAALLPDTRRQVRTNLRRVLGRRSPVLETVDVARTFAAYAGCLAEALAAERPEALAARRTLRPGTRLPEELTAGRGVIVVTAHAGAWDLGAMLLARDLGLDVALVMRREPDAEARELHDGVRRRAGAKVVHVGEHPLDALPLVHHLRRGGVVAAQLDRPPPGSPALGVELFGRPFQVSKGPFSLAAAARVAVVPLFVRRAGFFDYELSAGAAVELPRRPSDAELTSAAQQVSWDLERFLYANPTQWFCFED